LEELTKYLDSGYAVDVLYLQFQKAFDKVPHNTLITKLAAHHVDGNVLRWNENWLSNRKQRVVLNGHCSGWIAVVSGVPQGSVLGPLLFLIFINDIDELLISKMYKFADDIKIFHAVAWDVNVSILKQDLCKLAS